MVSVPLLMLGENKLVLKSHSPLQTKMVKRKATTATGDLSRIILTVLIVFHTFLKEYFITIRMEIMCFWLPRSKTQNTLTSKMYIACTIGIRKTPAVTISDPIYDWKSVMKLHRRRMQQAHSPGYDDLDQHFSTHGS